MSVPSKPPVWEDASAVGETSQEATSAATHDEDETSQDVDSTSIDDTSYVNLGGASH